jgi:DNA topoisomerase-6 subunit B
MKRTGGAKTDQILGHDSGPEGLPHSIIVTPEGTEGEAPVLPGTATAEVAPVETAKPEKPVKGKKTKAAKTAKAKAKPFTSTGKAGKRKAKPKPAKGKKKR